MASISFIFKLFLLKKWGNVYWRLKVVKISKTFFLNRKEWLRLKKEYLRVQKENMMSLKKTLEQHKQVKEIGR